MSSNRTCSTESDRQAKSTTMCAHTRDALLGGWHLHRSIKLYSGWPTLVLVAAFARPRHRFTSISSGRSVLVLIIVIASIYRTHNAEQRGHHHHCFDQLLGDRPSSHCAVTTISLLLWPFPSSNNETPRQPEHGSKWQDARPLTTSTYYKPLLSGCPNPLIHTPHYGVNQHHRSTSAKPTHVLVAAHASCEHD